MVLRVTLAKPWGASRECSRGPMPGTMPEVQGTMLHFHWDGSCLISKERCLPGRRFLSLRAFLQWFPPTNRPSPSPLWPWLSFRQASLLIILMTCLTYLFAYHFLIFLCQIMSPFKMMLRTPFTHKTSSGLLFSTPALLFTCLSLAPLCLAPQLSVCLHLLIYVTVLLNLHGTFLVFLACHS